MSGAIEAVFEMIANLHIPVEAGATLADARTELDELREDSGGKLYRAEIDKIRQELGCEEGEGWEPKLAELRRDREHKRFLLDHPDWGVTKSGDSWVIFNRHTGYVRGGFSSEDAAIDAAMEEGE